MPLLYASIAILIHDAGYNIVAYLLIGKAIIDLLLTGTEILLRLVKLIK